VMMIVIIAFDILTFAVESFTFYDKIRQHCLFNFNWNASVSIHALVTWK